MTDISFDWVLDGAIGAGLAMSDENTGSRPAPGQYDALAETAHSISIRKLPEDAAVHSSVEVYLREHPQYWKRLPARVTWSDLDWAARGERLVRVAGTAATITDASLEASFGELVSNIAELTPATRV